MTQAQESLANKYRNGGVVAPATGDAVEIVPGILWLRLPLPFRLNHVNVYLFEDDGTKVCNARVSDRIGDAALLRIDEIHHTIALFPTDRAGIQHINHQVATGDDVMRSFHFLSERRVPMVFGPGRHPTSSARFLYFEGPDGMVFEYSSGVREIADELLYREHQLPFDPKGFCEWGAKPQIKEFRN
jgi:2,3-dihydroxy-p-cumate/2,3-dihydroxybenzoate 3,4-dioxygenase